MTKSLLSSFTKKIRKKFIFKVFKLAERNEQEARLDSMKLRFKGSLFFSNCEKNKFEISVPIKLMILFNWRPAGILFHRSFQLKSFAAAAEILIFLWLLVLIIVLNLVCNYKILLLSFSTGIDRTLKKEVWAKCCKTFTKEYRKLQKSPNIKEYWYIL